MRIERWPAVIILVVLSIALSSHAKTKAKRSSRAKSSQSESLESSLQSSLQGSNKKSSSSKEVSLDEIDLDLDDEPAKPKKKKPAKKAKVVKAPTQKPVQTPSQKNEIVGDELVLDTDDLDSAKTARKPASGGDDSADEETPAPIRTDLSDVAETLLGKGHTKAVIDLLKPAMNNLDRRGLLFLAKAFRAEGDFPSELQALQLAAGKGTNDYVLQTQIADSLAFAGKLEEATMAYREAIEFNKRYQAAYEGLLKVFEKQGDRYEARTLVNTMIQLFGKNPSLQSALCRNLAMEDYLEKAIEACREAVALDPDNADNYIHLGMSLKDQQDVKGASLILAKAAKRFPASEPVQASAGEIKAFKKDYSAAYGFYKKATEADPKSARSWLGYAQAAFEVQKNEESVEAFVSACKLDRKLQKEFRYAIAKLKEKKDTKWAVRFEDAVLRCE